jgi:integrase
MKTQFRKDTQVDPVSKRKYTYFIADARSLGGKRKKLKTIRECNEYMDLCHELKVKGLDVGATTSVRAGNYFKTGFFVKQEASGNNNVKKFLLDENGLRILRDAGEYLTRRYELYKTADLSFGSLQREFYTCRILLNCLNPKDIVANINGEMLNEKLDSYCSTRTLELRNFENFEHAKAKAHGSYKSTYKTANSIFNIFSKTYKAVNPFQHTSLIKKSLVKASIGELKEFKSLNYEKTNIDDLFYMMFESYKGGIHNRSKKIQLKWATSLKCQIMVLLGTGIRRGELTALTWEDLQEEATVGKEVVYSLRINKSYSRCADLLKRPKSNLKRTSTISPALFQELMEYKKLLSLLDLKNDLMFPNTQGNLDKKCRLYYALNTANKRLHGPYRSHGHRWTTIHDLRHVYATEFIKQGGDIQRLSKYMGHSTTKVTEEVYVSKFELTSEQKISDLQYQKPIHRVSFDTITK